MRKNSKLVALLIALSAVCVLLCSCSAGKESKPQASEAAPEITHTATITVECAENLLFSKYDVKVFVDGNEVGVQDHGTSKTYEIQLTDGTHSFKAADKDRLSVDGTADFVVEGDTRVRFKVSCTNDQVGVQAIEQKQAPLLSSEAVNKSSEEVESSFREAGFTRVTTEAIKDLTADKASQNMLVEKVAINSSDVYTKDDKFFVDDEIVISYHTLAEVHPPATEDELKTKSVGEVRDAFAAAGFTNIKEETITTTDESDDGKVTSVDIPYAIFGYDTEDSYDPDTEVVITYKKYDADKAAEESAEKESRAESTAKSAVIANAKNVFEDYASRVFYPSKVSCHWLTNRIACEVNPDNSVFLKVGITIKSNAGGKIETVAEGTVTGGTVVDFYAS